MSRASWQWALGEADRATPVRGAPDENGGGGQMDVEGSGRGGGGKGTSAKSAPLKRPQIRPAARGPPEPRGEAGRREKMTMTLPPTTRSAAAALPPGAAAQASIAEAQISARAAKLKVVERLMDAPAVGPSQISLATSQDAIEVKKLGCNMRVESRRRGEQHLLVPAPTPPSPTRTQCVARRRSPRTVL